MGGQSWFYILLSRYIFQVCEMLHLSGSTFRHGALISSYISKWCLRDANKMGSQPWCYISLSRHIIQVCEMLHLSGSTFRHGALLSSYICKWWLLHVQSEFLSSGESQGHYVCDVQDRLTTSWFRTNDNAYPVPINQNQVTKKAYVVLLNRSN